ncbi:hypothetical protein EV424DRAFT_1349766 [Suillus variegatus]|nr:hypothetical protein EV424DRAFT_1349766 [Suillus variegatus]
MFQGEDVDQNSLPKKLMRGLSHLSLATLHALFKSKLASHEAACQCLVLTAWEVEESERFTAFLNGLHHENQDHLLFSDEELKKHLGSHIKKDILGSMGKSSHSPQFVGKSGPSSDTDDIMDDDKSDDGDDNDNSDKCKGKAAISKPPRGSGLNPSDFPAAGQLNLSAEQPQMSAFDFDPYAQSEGERQATQQQFHDAHGSLSYGDGGGLSSYDPAQGSLSYGDGGGLSLYGPTQGSLSYGDGGGSSSYGPAQGSSSYADGGGPSLYSLVQGSLSYGDGGGPSSYGPAQGSSSYVDDNSYDFYNHFWDDSGPSFTDFPPDHHPRQVTPVPRWIKEAPDGGSNVTE